MSCVKATQWFVFTCEHNLKRCGKHLSLLKIFFFSFETFWPLGKHLKITSASTVAAKNENCAFPYLNLMDYWKSNFQVDMYVVLCMPPHVFLSRGKLSLKIWKLISSFVNNIISMRRYYFKQKIECRLQKVMFCVPSKQLMSQA